MVAENFCDIGACGSLDTLPEQFAHVGDGVCDAGLAENLDGAGFEAGHGHLGAFFGEGVDDGGWDWVEVHDSAEECEAVHARHFDIECDDIGLFADDKIACDVGILRGGDDFDTWDFVEFFCERLSDD